MKAYILRSRSNKDAVISHQEGRYVLFVPEKGIAGASVFTKIQARKCLKDLDDSNLYAVQIKLKK